MFQLNGCKKQLSCRCSFYVIRFTLRIVGCIKFTFFLSSLSATTYKISVYTADVPEADTKANVFIKLFGEHGNSEQLALRQSETKRKKFLPGQVDVFTFREQPWLGKLSKIRVWHDNEGSSPAWYLSSIYVLDELSAKLYGFVIDSWLSKEHGAVLKDSGCAGVVLHKELGKSKRKLEEISQKTSSANVVYTYFRSFGHSFGKSSLVC